MTDESMEDALLLSEGGPKASEILPVEVNERTKMGEFASKVLFLVERQTGISITAHLTDMSNVFAEGLYGDSTPAVAVSKDGNWVIRGYRDTNRGGNSKTLKGSVILVEIRHVADVSRGSVSYDQTMEIEYLGTPEGKNRGTVKYIDKTEPEESGVIIGDSRHWTQTDEPKILLYGDPPGINRSRLNSPNKNIPQVIGHFIDKLPGKSEFEHTKTRTTISEVLQRRNSSK